MPILPLGNCFRCQLTMQEAMRLFPPVAPGQTMITKGHFKLTPELVLPPGILMSMPHCAMFTNSRLWDRSQEFFPGIFMNA